MKVNCIAVDDEPLALDVIESHLNQIPSFNLLARCSSAIEANEFLNQNQVDLIFLDIQMPEMNGIDFLKTLSQKPKVIFTTAYPNYALEGYNLDVVDYLLKPISFDRFLQAINKVQRQLKTTNVGLNQAVPAKQESIFVKADKKLIRIFLEDIYYLEGMKDYVKICAEKETIAALMTMKHIDEVLPDEKFVRVHKSYIINIAKIKSIVGNSIEINDKLVPIGKSYKEAFFKHLDGFNLVN